MRCYDREQQEPDFGEGKDEVRENKRRRRNRSR
jgi:hypothetical protein